MIIGYPEIILAITTAIILITLGALISSLLNRRIIRAMKRDMEHMRNNQRAVAQALIVKEAKDDVRHAAQDARAAADDVAALVPREVTIVNNADEPVPVEDVNGKP